MKVCVTVRWHVNSQEIEKTAQAEIPEQVYLISGPPGSGPTREQDVKEMARALFESIALSSLPKGTP